MSKGGTPPQADYIGAAREQGRQNIDAARIGAALNRVNQRNPYGSVSYNQTGRDQWEQVTELSPEQQAIFNERQGTDLDLSRIAGTRLSQVGSQDPFSLAGQPERVTNVQPSDFRTNINAPNVAQRDVNLDALDPRRSADYQMGVDFSGAPELPGAGDFSGERQRVEDALYRQHASKLDPQFAQEREGMRTQLINQGLREGSEAYNTELANFERRQQAAYGDARDRSILAGGGEQSRLFGDSLSARNSRIAEILSGGQFANQAADATNQYGLQSRGQDTSEAFQRGTFANQAAQQEFQTDLTRAGFENAAADTEFSQGQQNAALTNAGRDAGINEQILERSIPMQEFMSLYGGGSGGAGGISGGTIPGVAGPEAADYAGAVAQQGQSAIDLYNSQQQRRTGNVQAGAGLVAAAITAF